MNWIELNKLEQLTDIDEQSTEFKILIFKHSTRCSFSSASLDRLSRNWNTELDKKFKTYYLDLLKNRTISNEIEKRYAVRHESPQILVVESGRCIYNASHSMIRTEFLPG